MQRASTLAAIVATTAPAAAGSLAALGFDGPITIFPGSSTSTRVIIDADGATGFFGYSLALKVVPHRGATGTIAIDVESAIDPAHTNLFLANNLIAAYPAPLDPFFTVILPQGTNGVFINANINIFDPMAPDFVTATTGVNDVLAELVFDASADASGTFDLVLGPATALSDPNGFAIPFIYVATAIDVDTTPPPSPDLNGDGIVGAADLAILLGDWGGCPSLPPDLDGSGDVGAADLAILLGQWGATGGPADFNQDGIVGPGDLANLLGEWGNIVPPCADLNEDGTVSASDLSILLGAWSG